MRAPCKTTLAVAAAAALAALAPEAAPAQGTFQQVFDDFRPDQRIDACRWTPDQLRQARGQTPPDIEQYAPSFLDEVGRALEEHARGGCRPQREEPAPPPEPPPPPPDEPNRASPGPQPEPPAPLQAEPTLAGSAVPPLDESAPLPLALALLGAALCAALAAAAGYAVARYTGWDLARPLRPLATRARTLSERGSDVTAGLWDRLRLGR